MTVRLAIFRQVPIRLPARRVAALFAAVVATEFQAQSGQIHLVIVSPGRIRDLNRTFRQIDRETDVLSFPIDRGRSKDDVIGEIYLCRQVADRQAKQFEASQSEEYLRLFCHGLLHLAGYDHQTPAQERTMFRRQNRYLASVAPAYGQ